MKMKPFKTLVQSKPMSISLPRKLTSLIKKLRKKEGSLYDFGVHFTTLDVEYLVFYS
jgi:hypothetical protein